MIKCFWCGTVSSGTEKECRSCHRVLQWSPLLQAILRPSIGCLLGARAEAPAVTSNYHHG